ncbi:MAG: FMN-binding protein [Candidatus Limnocylindrales bacterium]
MSKRPLIATLLTTAALALLLSFKTPQVISLTTTTGGGGGGGGSQSGGGAPGAAGTPGAGATAGSHTSYSGQVTGDAVQTPFGTVQVQVTIQSGTITDVQALQLPTGGGHTQEVSAYAGPQLRNEALQAQSAQIDTISGATYTSEGYIQSLQSALSQAGM